MCFLCPIAFHHRHPEKADRASLSRAKPEIQNHGPFECWRNPSRLVSQRNNSSLLLALGDLLARRTTHFLNVRSKHSHWWILGYDTPVRIFLQQEWSCSEACIRKHLTDHPANLQIQEFLGVRKLKSEFSTSWCTESVQLYLLLLLKKNHFSEGPRWWYVGFWRLREIAPYLFFSAKSKNLEIYFVNRPFLRGPIDSRRRIKNVHELHGPATAEAKWASMETNFPTLLMLSSYLHNTPGPVIPYQAPRLIHKDWINAWNLIYGSNMVCWSLNKMFPGSCSSC